MNVNNQLKPLHSGALETLQKLRNKDVAVTQSGGTQKNGEPKTNRSERSLFERLARHNDGVKAKKALPPINQLADKFVKGLSTGKMTPAKAVSLLSQMHNHAVQSNGVNPQAEIYTALKEQLATMSKARQQSFGNMLSPKVVSLITDHMDKSLGKNQDLQSALHLINPGMGFEPPLEPKVQEGDTKNQQLKNILVEMQKAISPGSYADAQGREMSSTQIREVEVHLLNQIAGLDDAPQGASATDVRSPNDKFRTAVADEIRVGAFDQCKEKGANKLNLEQSVGVIKSAYENQPVMPLEKFKILMSSNSVGKAVGTLTGNNVPRKEKVGDDTPALLEQGARELKQLIDNTLTPTEKRDLKSRIDFLCSYAPIAKSKFGLAEKGENDPSMQDKQWIKSVAVSFGLFVGIPQEQIASGTKLRSDGILARDVITALAVHRDIIFEDLQTQDDKFWSDLGKLVNSGVSEEQIASFCEANDRPVPSLAEIKHRLDRDNDEIDIDSNDTGNIEITKEEEPIKKDPSSEGVSNQEKKPIQVIANTPASSPKLDLGKVSLMTMEDILVNNHSRKELENADPGTIREEFFKLDLTLRDKQVLLEGMGVEVPDSESHIEGLFLTHFGK